MNVCMIWRLGIVYSTPATSCGRTWRRSGILKWEKTLFLTIWGTWQMCDVRVTMAGVLLYHYVHLVCKFLTWATLFRFYEHFESLSFFLASVPCGGSDQKKLFIFICQKSIIAVSPLLCIVLQCLYVCPWLLKEGSSTNRRKYRERRLYRIRKYWTVPTEWIQSLKIRWLLQILLYYKI